MYTLASRHILNVSHRELCRLNEIARSISSSCIRRRYWEPDKKGGKYNTEIKVPHSKIIKDGMKEIKAESIKFKDEWITKFNCDSTIPINHGDYEIVWRFDSNESVSLWNTTVDSDHNEGKSKASFTLSNNRKGLFSGILNPDIPKDGVVKSAGYANIRSPKNYISFKRERPYLWGEYTHMVLGVRGDGRVYQFIIHMDHYYDLQWNDQYNYPLYTRGGPYWQLTKIPFSKFFLSSKGRVQDKQKSVDLERVKSVGITVADSVPGPFSLEIDFIGLMYDETHVDVFDYEMYPVSIAVHS